METRLIIDGPQTGAANMAVDEMLLQSAAASGLSTLRFYRWAEPTVTLGYFQSFADGDQHASSRNCPRIRRSTGGGAIVHDQELTYSLAIPLGDRWANSPQFWYDTMHQSLIDVLRPLGLDARQCRLGESRGSLGELRGESPFLCFQRRALGDVLVGANKICGSAQRRQCRAMLQHGSFATTQRGSSTRSRQASRCT